VSHDGLPLPLGETIPAYHQKGKKKVQTQPFEKVEEAHSALTRWWTGDHSSHRSTRSSNMIEAFQKGVQIS
jgi:hypothetical protein